MEALRASYQIIDGIINAIPVRVFWKDKNLVYLGCNAEFARDKGFADAKEIIGKDDYQIGWREDAEMYRRDDRKVIKTGCEKHLFEEHQTSPEGKIKTILASKIPLRGPNGEVCGVIGTYMDITERKQAEELLRLQSGALEAAANGIVITDTKGVIEWANAALTTLTGYSVEEVIGRNPRVWKSGKHDEVFYRNLWETVSAGKVWRGEIVNRRKDGELYTEEMTITPIKDGQGELAHFIGVKQDITARKSLEAEFLRAQRMESIGTLASGLAHELDNGLAPILMAVEALKYRVTEAGGLKLLALVTSSVEHCTELVSQVLTCARGAEGQPVIVNPVYLPANTSTRTVEDLAMEKGGLPRGNGETVLLVDDEERLRAIARRTLEEFGYRVLLAANGEEAVDLYERHGEEIAMVLTDMAMPVMDGASTIVALRALNPRIRIIGSSGVESDGGDVMAEGAGIKYFVPKPYRAETMLHILAKALQEAA